MSMDAFPKTRGRELTAVPSLSKGSTLSETGNSPGYEPFVLLSGVSYRSAAVELRERLAAADLDRSQAVLAEALLIPEVKEAVVVSTCNRVELVIAGMVPQVDPKGAPSIESRMSREMEKLFAELSKLPREAFAGSMYHLKDRDAVSHLFRVAAGLDSMVLGEPQVLGQVKAAFRFAQDQGAAKAVLNKLFHRAFGVAKLVRTQTRLGRYAVSMCYAARQLAAQIFGDLSGSSVMVLGAGEMGALALKHFVAAGVSEVFIVNKTYERAIELARTCAGVPLTFQQLPQFLDRSDIIVGASTLPAGSPPLIDRKMVEPAWRHRAGRPQFYVDLAVPRNVDPAVDALDDLFLYNVDDLQEIVKRNLEGREQEIAHAELLIGEAVGRFVTWISRRKVEHSLAELAARFDTLKEREIERTLKRLNREEGNEVTPQAVRDALDQLADSLIAKVLHQPLTSLRHARDDDELFDAFCRMFFEQRSERPSAATDHAHSDGERSGLQIRQRK